MIDGDVFGDAEAVVRFDAVDRFDAAADAFRGDDEKTSVLRRTIIPLVLSALKDAYDASRPATPPVRRNIRR